MQEHEDLARYERLIFKVSHKTMRRLLAAGAKSVAFEDVVQEYRIGWLAASRSYNPDLGVPWMPYLINGLRKYTFSILRKYTFKVKVEQYAISIWDTLDTEDGNGSVLEELVAGESVDPALAIGNKQILLRSRERLSKRAWQFLMLLSETPPEISEQVLRLRDKAEHGRKLGLRVGANMTVTAAMIFDLMDADRPERISIVRELKHLGEKNCRKI